MIYLGVVLWIISAALSFFGKKYRVMVFSWIFMFTGTGTFLIGVYVFALTIR